MMRIELGQTSPYCDRRSRRSFLQLGIAGIASVGLPDILKAKAATSQSFIQNRLSIPTNSRSFDRCIMILAITLRQLTESSPPRPWA